MLRMKLSRQFNSHAGFSLIEIAIVLGILALLLALFAGMSTNLINQHRRELTRTRLANIDTALTLFVLQYKRLPCPADGTQASTTLGAQKNYVSLYLFACYGEDVALLKGELKKAGKRFDMGKCCLHFKSLDDLELNSVVNMIAFKTPAQHLAIYKKEGRFWV